MRNTARTTRRRKRANAIAQRRLPLAMSSPPHATIDISLAARTLGIVPSPSATLQSPSVLRESRQAVSAGQRSDYYLGQ